MRAVAVYFSLCLIFLAVACDSTHGEPYELDELGYQSCAGYFDCGPGRFCTEEALCWAECRLTPDCHLVAENTLCNPFGDCVEQGGGTECNAHADCEEGHFCNGVCASGGAVCGDSSECSLGGDCVGTCSQACGSDNDCTPFDPMVPDTEFLCTPVGQCLLTGWERWISPGELPPTSCKQDSHCVALGWGWRCDCDKTPDPKTGIPRCTGGAESACVPTGEPIDFGSGPESSPAHDFAGVWGMRMEIGVVTEVPIIGYQNTYSANIFLVKVSHEEGNKLKITEKLCDLQLINFIDSDEDFNDLGWMIITARYVKSLGILEREVELSSGTAGSPWLTTQSVEVRGCVIDDPMNSPLPDRDAFLADPNDVRFWDQDEDGNVGMTTLMDGIMRGKIFNVQRWKAIYDGEIINADHIKGLAAIDNEQLIIDASKPDLIQSNSQSTIHSQADRTYFRMMRFPDPETSCADIIRAAALDGSWLAHTPHLDDVPNP